MTCKRFLPEGYVNKVLFYSLFLFFWPIFGMHRSPRIPLIPREAIMSHTEIVEIDDRDTINRPGCNFCERQAVWIVFIDDVYIIHYCFKHFISSHHTKDIE